MESHKKPKSNELLKRINPHLVCPMCGNMEFGVPSDYISLTAYNDYKAEYFPLKLPCVALVCTKCGYISLHAIGVLTKFEDNHE